MQIITGKPIPPSAFPYQTKSPTQTRVGSRRNPIIIVRYLALIIWLPCPKVCVLRCLFCIHHHHHQHNLEHPDYCGLKPSQTHLFSKFLMCVDNQIHKSIQQALGGDQLTFSLSPSISVFFPASRSSRLATAARALSKARSLTRCLASTYWGKTGSQERVRETENGNEKRIFPDIKTVELAKPEETICRLREQIRAF